MLLPYLYTVFCQTYLIMIACALDQILMLLFYCHVYVFDWETEIDTIFRCIVKIQNRFIDEMAATMLYNNLFHVMATGSYTLNVNTDKQNIVWVVMFRDCIFHVTNQPQISLLILITMCRVLCLKPVFFILHINCSIIISLITML